MTTKQIAHRLVELCRQGKYEEVQNELFSNDAESIEPAGSPGLQTVKGLDAIKEKGKQFQSMVEAIHDTSVSDPVVAGNWFAISIILEVTMKGTGRTKMEEIAVYQVKDGKITREQFSY